MAADNDLATESELTLEEAVLSTEPDEDQIDTTEVAGEDILPAVFQPSTVSMRNLLDLLYNAHKASVTNDTNYIT